MHPFCKNLKNLLSKYDIRILSLDEKRHEFEFEGGNEFFEAFEQEIIESGNFKAFVLLDKSSSMIQLDIKIAASLNLICDRSLEEFTEDLVLNEKYIFKFGDKFEMISDEVEIIPFGTNTINLSQHFFDFMSLSVPMKRLHPKFRDEDYEEEKLIYSDENQEIAKASQEEQEIDPRWQALAKLKDLNK